MKYLSILFLLLAPSIGYATGITETKITKVLVGEVYGNKAFISLSPKPGIPSGHCQDNPNFSYVFDISTDVGKSTLSMVLAAYMSQKSVYVNGYDTCAIYSGVESLRQIQLQ